MFKKAGRSDLVPPSHRKSKVRSDKGKHHKGWKRKIRKDAGTTKLDPKLIPLQGVAKRKGGPLSAAEEAATEAMVLSSPPSESPEDLEKRTKALAIALGRQPGTIRKEIISARERLQERSTDYADLHFKAAQIAASDGNAGPAQWALERISAPTEDGKGVERIVQPLKTTEDGPKMPVVNIGIALGGIAAGAQLKSTQKAELPPIDVEIEEKP